MAAGLRIGLHVGLGYQVILATLALCCWHHYKRDSFWRQPHFLPKGSAAFWS